MQGTFRRKSLPKPVDIISPVVVCKLHNSCLNYRMYSMYSMKKQIASQSLHVWPCPSSSLSGIELTDPFDYTPEDL